MANQTTQPMYVIGNSHPPQAEAAEQLASHTPSHVAQLTPSQPGAAPASPAKPAAISHAQHVTRAQLGGRKRAEQRGVQYLQTLQRDRDGVETVHMHSEDGTVVYSYRRG